MANLRSLPSRFCLGLSALAWVSLVGGCSGPEMPNMDDDPSMQMGPMGPSGPMPQEPALTDPGQAPWVLVPKDQVATVCKMDPELLTKANEILKRPFAVVRFGRLCHEHYPSANPDAMSAAWSATKTLSSLTVGMVAYETRDLQKMGRKTGPLSDVDRVDHWLDSGSISFNKEALVAHVLAMVAHNKSLEYGQKRFAYDAVGTTQINRLSDILNVAIAQDSKRLGGNLEGFVQRYLFGPLGMKNSVWSEGKPDKVMAYGWITNVRDMARIGLLLRNGGLWNGKRLLAKEWVYKIGHPAFEDASTGYGYLAWLNSLSNHTDLTGNKEQGPDDPCAPAAQHQRFPHPPSEARDCGYSAPYMCGQKEDSGVFYASGLGGQYIVIHPGLDLVLVVKDLSGSAKDLWKAIRPALVKLDPGYSGNEEGFCKAYSAGSYAPNLRYQPLAN